MGFFSSFFSSSAKYSQEEHPLTAEQIRHIVSEFKISTLSQGEEALVEEAIITRRRGDGKISLRQVYEVLTQLKNQHKISVQDRDGLMKVFSGYFDSHFSE